MPVAPHLPCHPGVNISPNISKYSLGGAEPPFLKEHHAKEGSDLRCFDFFICTMGSIFMTLKSVTWIRCDNGSAIVSKTSKCFSNIKCFDSYHQLESLTEKPAYHLQATNPPPSCPRASVTLRPMGPVLSLDARWGTGMWALSTSLITLVAED